MTPDSPLLLVEDDNAFRERLARALESRGIPVVAVATVADARVVAAQKRLSGAVIDLRLAGESGLPLVSELIGRQPGLPVVMLTGFGSIALALEAVRLGAKDFLTKPADPDQILAALRGGAPWGDNPKEVPIETPSLGRVEWEHIQRVLADCGGNISQAARLLGIDRRSLQRKLAKFPPTR